MMTIDWNDLAEGFAGPKEMIEHYYSLNTSIRKTAAKIGVAYWTLWCKMKDLRVQSRPMYIHNKGNSRKRGNSA